MSGPAPVRTVKQCPASRASNRNTGSPLNRGAFRARFCATRSLCRLTHGFCLTLCCYRKPVGDGLDELKLLQLAGLFPSRARSPPRAARETRHMSSCARNGLAIFLVYLAVDVSIKFRLKYRWAGAHMLAYRAPAYVGVGGLGGAVLSALLQAVARAPPAAPQVVPSGLFPAAAGPQDTCSEPFGLAAPVVEGWPASNLLLLSAGLGAFLLIFSFVLGVIVGGCGGFFLGYLWSSAGRGASPQYGTRG